MKELKINISDELLRNIIKIMNLEDVYVLCKVFNDIMHYARDILYPPSKLILLIKIKSNKYFRYYRPIAISNI